MSPEKQRITLPELMAMTDEELNPICKEEWLEPSKGIYRADTWMKMKESMKELASSLSDKRQPEIEGPIIWDGKQWVDQSLPTSGEGERG